MPTPAAPAAPTRRQPENKSLLLGFAERVRGPSGKWQVHFRWKRIMAVIAGMLVMAYLAQALALFLFFKYRNKFEDVRYRDMLTYWVNRDEHQRRVGDYQIRKGIEFLEEGKYREAFAYLRGGVHNAPRNLQGRQLLANIYLGMREPDLALNVMSQGAPYAYDNAEYLNNYVQLLLQLQKDQQAIDLAQAVLNSTPPPAQEITHIMAWAAAMAHFYRGDFDRTEDILRQYNLGREIQGQLLLSRISWERGQRQAAIDRLLTALNKYPTNEPFYAQLSFYYREMGNYTEARRYAVMRSISAPLSIAPRIELLYVLQGDGQKERVQRETLAILNQFGDSDQSISQLGTFAATQGLVELSQTIYKRAEQNRFPMATYTLQLIEAYINAKDFQQAIALTEQINKEQPGWLQQHLPIFNSLRAIAYYGAGNSNMSSMYLGQFLQTPQLRIDAMVGAAKHFERLGGFNLAREILLNAYQRNTSSQVVLTNLIEMEIATGNAADLGQYLNKLLQMRRPSVLVLNKAYTELASDRFLYTPNRDELLVELRSALNRSNERTDEAAPAPAAGTGAAATGAAGATGSSAPAATAANAG